MCQCPVCKALDAGSFGQALARVADRALLIELACDFAEHVACLTPEPVQAKSWLEATRDWNDNPKAAAEAAQSSCSATLGWKTKAAATRESVNWATCWALSAVECATEALTADETWTARAVKNVADWACSAKGWKPGISQPVAASAPERAWQKEQVRRLACERVLAQPAQSISNDSRSRKSLLAK